ncbi:MAG: hypothetical protein DSY70_05015 [Desulfobulbus sp.]|nr:MAG: hypothetical protein DSY70_05015 [Desulfobulbus sp.]
MINNCPLCRVALTYTERQLEKIDEALKALEPGKHLTIKCPQCKKGIKLFAPEKKTVPGEAVAPPGPPNLEWLKTGRFEDEEKVEDVPMALVLHPDPAGREKVKAAMESVGYLVVIVGTVREAIEQMRFINFACITFHAEFEGGVLADSVFHDYMRRMAMERRRYIFYILLGPQFHSLYDLEALAHSANLVVAEKDIDHFDLVLRKAIPDYEELFGTILEELGSYGKR